jgi:hypothetical protein
VDDNARALVVFGRAGHFDQLYGRALATTLAAIREDRWMNRISSEGVWSDRDASEDSLGRAVWGLATHLDHHPDDGLAAEALAQAARFTVNAPRSQAYAVLGWSRILDHPAVRVVAGAELHRRVGSFSDPLISRWCWPESRLAYDNARLCEARIAAGSVLGRPTLVEGGLAMLEWLCRTEWLVDHFSFTPVSGRGPDDPKPAFDQQPIEAWAMLDACRLAARQDPNNIWERYATWARLWFHGANDASIPMLDLRTGAGYDGLTPNGRNANRGAESTLAAIAAILDGHQHGSGTS